MVQAPVIVSCQSNGSLSDNFGGSLGRLQSTYHISRGFGYHVVVTSRDTILIGQKVSGAVASSTSTISLLDTYILSWHGDEEATL
jgi:hypothetical protein